MEIVKAGDAVLDKEALNSGPVKAALGDCDYFTCPKGDAPTDKSGFVDFTNADGGTGKP